MYYFAEVYIKNLSKNCHLQIPIYQKIIMKNNLTYWGNSNHSKNHLYEKFILGEKDMQS